MPLVGANGQITWWAAMGIAFTAKGEPMMTVELPCKMGDHVWGIHKINYHKYVVQQGVVNQMYFGDDMRLCICIKNVCRGEWGKVVFATKEEAERAIAERKVDVTQCVTQDVSQI
jgi:hypothetical protein